MKNKLRVNADYFCNEGARISKVIFRLGSTVTEGILPYFNKDYPEAILIVNNLLEYL